MVLQTNSSQEAHEMLTSKFRTIIIALVAASGLALASMAPVASQAATNTGAYAKSADSNNYKVSPETCETDGKAFEKFVNEAGKYYETEGNSANFQASMSAAGIVLDLAQKGGCDWAANVRLPEYPPASTLVNRTPVSSLIK
jgi:hypothetical protein